MKTPTACAAPPFALGAKLFQTMTQVAVDRASTVVPPLPLGLLGKSSAAENAPLAPRAWAE